MQTNPTTDEILADIQDMVEKTDSAIRETMRLARLLPYGQALNIQVNLAEALASLHVARQNISHGT